MLKWLKDFAMRLKEALTGEYMYKQIEEDHEEFLMLQEYFSKQEN